MDPARKRERTGWLFRALLLAALALPVPAWAQPPQKSTAAAPALPVVRLATAEWPPYLGDRLPEDGAIGAVLNAALATQGYRVELRFFPWARTLLLARDPAAGFDGYVVDYYSDQVARDYLLSKPVAYSPLVLAERVDHPLAWHTEDDLVKYRLGLVTGYINTATIDRQVANGNLRVEFVSDDASNLRILAAGRIDAAVIDSRVLAWVQATDPVLRAGGHRLRANAQVLEEKPLYACFRRTKRGQLLQSVLDSGLRRIDARAVFEDYLRRHNPAPPAAR